MPISPVASAISVLPNCTKPRYVWRVLLRKAFRYRVYPTPQQESRLVAWESSLRWLWNIAHEQRLLGLARQRAERRYYTGFDQMKQLTELRSELPWLADVPRNVCAQLLSELDKAWQCCFQRLSRAPRWKRKGRDFLSLCESHSEKWRLAGDVLRFPKLGNMQTVVHRPLEGTPKTCTLKRDVDQWFAIVVCEIETPEPAQRLHPVVGIDRGITHLLADSDGKLTANPRCYERAMKRLAHAQRVVCRRKKGSKNREKAKHRVAVLHRKVRRQRAHYLHVESTRYAKSHGVVVIEKLNTAGMMRGSCSRSIADAGWGMLANMLRYKLAWSGGTLIEVPAAYSSQTCSECGTVDAKSRHGVRFRCTGCGFVGHADLNAAKIIKNRANRSVLPVEGSAPEAARRSRKAKVRLRGTRRSPLQSSSL